MSGAVQGTMRIYMTCVVVFLLGVALWVSGIGPDITRFFAAVDTPLTNNIWRIIGQLGLGRWQLVGCLLAAWWCTRQHRQHTRVPLRWVDVAMVAKLFAGAFYIWLRLLVFKTAPVIGNRFFWQRAAKYCQQLPWKARVWLYGIPVMFGAGAVCTVLKMLIGRPRPKMMLWYDTMAAIGPTLNAKFHSFPSGHTTTTFALLAVLHTAFPQYRWVWWPVACLTAFARVGAVTPHFLGDVAAGAAIGYGVGYYLLQQYRLAPRR